MKKIITLVFMSAVLALTSCNDFLDKYPKYGVDPESEVTNEIAVALTTACYKTLQSSNMYNQRIWSLDIIAGNSEVGAGGGTDGLETVQASNFIAQSDNGFALYVWRSPWVGIGRCNIVLSNLPSASVSNEIKTRCMGEAYFLRAHYYYILVRLYGGVPLRLEPFEPGESADIARNTVDEVYAQIIKDVDASIASFKEAGVKYSTNGGANSGRASLAAALMLKARVVMYQKDNAKYAEAASGLAEIIASGEFELTSKYADIWVDEGEFNKESIFEANHIGEGKDWGNQWATGGTNLPAYISPSTLSDPTNTYESEQPVDKESTRRKIAAVTRSKTNFTKSSLGSIKTGPFRRDIFTVTILINVMRYICKGFCPKSQ
jgi:hypothetical protein